MQSQEIAQRPRKVWVAVLLALLSAGLGHVYAGRPRRGVVIWILSLAFIMCAPIAVWKAVARPQWAPPWNVVIPFGVVLAVAGAFLVLVLIDVVHVTRAAPAAGRRWFNRWDVYATFLMLNAFVVNGSTNWTRRNFLQAFWTPAGSMQPTLRIGDRFLVDKQAYAEGAPLLRGDIVVFVSPGDPKTVLVKRAVAIAGDTVEINQNNLFVNNAFVAEPYAYFAGAEPGMPTPANFGPVEVPAGEFFVLGDNRDRSYDSRQWGFAHVKDLLGRPTVVYFSSQDGTIRWERIGALLR
jgi:signal peptidase I